MAQRRAVRSGGPIPCNAETFLKPLPWPESPPLFRSTLPTRSPGRLGRTGDKVSLLGLGGAHMAGLPDDAAATAFMRQAIDAGITFFDNSWDYSAGLTEQRMGKALLDGYRHKVFLMTKTDSHTAAGFNTQLTTCMGRLQTDMIDLIQFHEVVRMTDPDEIFAPGGAIEAAIAARKAGKVRYIGFTGHKDPSIHLHMIETAEKHGFHFDTVQMPINVMDAHYRSFQHEVIPVAQKKGIGVLAMKTFGSGVMLKSKTATPLEMLQYSMTLPVASVITGMNTPELLQQGLTAARTFKPMQQAQIDDLLTRTKPAALDGKYEPFKISPVFDQTVRHPDWLA